MTLRARPPFRRGAAERTQFLVKRARAPRTPPGSPRWPSEARAWPGEMKSFTVIGGDDEIGCDLSDRETIYRPESGKDGSGMALGAVARDGFASRWVILAALFLARTAMGFQFQSIASTAPLLVRDLGASYAEIGTLIGLYMLPGAIIALPGGVFAGRVGDKRLCAAGLALMMLGGVMVGASHGVALAFMGRLLSGTGAVLFNLVITKMATDWFAGREIVFGMGVLLASWPCGIATGLLVQGPLAAAAGWPAVMHAAAGLCALSLLLIAAIYRPPPGAASEAAPAAPRLALPPLAETLPTIVAGMIWGAFNVALVVFFSFAPALFAEQGMAPLTAASLASMALWLTMLSVPLCGYAVERSGRANAAIVVFAVAAGLSLAALVTGALPALLSAAIGVAIGPPAGAIMALPARVLRPANRPAGLGLFYTVYYAILAFGPMLAGMLRDSAGTAAAAILFGAALFLAGPPLLWGFERLAAQRGAG
jgi:MFS family permease